MEIAVKGEIIELEPKLLMTKRYSLGVDMRTIPIEYHSIIFKYVGKMKYANLAPLGVGVLNLIFAIEANEIKKVNFERDGKTFL